MIGHLGDQAAELLGLSDAGGAAALRGLAELAAAQVPGCAGATAVIWRGVTWPDAAGPDVTGRDAAGRDADDVTVAATHPDLAWLADVQMRDRAGPLIDAVRTGGRVRCADLADETRWPGFAAAALARAVRCSVHLARELPEPGMLVLGLYGLRPGTLDADPIAGTLAEFGRAVVANATAYGAARLVATQFRDAVAARSIVDQAKGILMHALGCDAEDALRRLRDEARRRDAKVTDVASEVVRSQGRPA